MIVIKRYSNRKLYNTGTKQYITLVQIAGYLESGDEVQVIEHATGQDITAAVLTQIIFESQRKEGSLFTHSFLTDLFQRSSQWLHESSGQISRRFSFSEWINIEIHRRITGLVDLNLILPDEGERLTNLLCSDSQVLADEAQINQQIRSILAFLQIPTRQDIDKVIKQIDLLEDRINSLKTD